MQEKINVVQCPIFIGYCVISVTFPFPNEIYKKPIDKQTENESLYLDYHYIDKKSIYRQHFFYTSV